MTRGPLPQLVPKIICGRRLEALRERAALAQTEVAAQTEFSQPKIASIEKGMSAVSKHDLELLLDLYGAEEPLRKELHELRRLGRVSHPRRKGLLRNRFDEPMRDVVDMEGSAATVWCHNSMVLPGLLQTETYMRYIFRAFRPSLTAAQIDQYTENRLGRQAVLDNPDQRFWFVVHEAALRSLEGIDGDRSVLEEQADHLLAVLDRPNVEIQVAPFRHGYYPGQEETYMIFGFDTDPLVRVAYVEKYDGGDILRADKGLARFTTFWEHQRVHALGPEQTRPFLRALARPS